MRKAFDAPNWRGARKRQPAAMCRRLCIMARVVPMRTARAHFVRASNWDWYWCPLSLSLRLWRRFALQSAGAPLGDCGLADCFLGGALPNPGKPPTSGVAAVLYFDTCAAAHAHTRHVAIWQGAAARCKRGVPRWVAARGAHRRPWRICRHLQAASCGRGSACSARSDHDAAYRIR